MSQIIESRPLSVEQPLAPNPISPLSNTQLQQQQLQLPISSTTSTTTSTITEPISSLQKDILQPQQFLQQQQAPQQQFFGGQQQGYQQFPSLQKAQQFTNLPQSQSQFSSVNTVSGAPTILSSSSQLPFSSSTATTQQGFVPQTYGGLTSGQQTFSKSYTQPSSFSSAGYSTFPSSGSMVTSTSGGPISSSFASGYGNVQGLSGGPSYSSFQPQQNLATTSTTGIVQQLPITSTTNIIPTSTTTTNIVQQLPATFRETQEETVVRVVSERNIFPEEVVVLERDVFPESQIQQHEVHTHRTTIEKEIVHVYPVKLEREIINVHPSIIDKEVTVVHPRVIHLKETVMHPEQIKHDVEERVQATNTVHEKEQRVMPVLIEEKETQVISKETVALSETLVAQRPVEYRSSEMYLQGSPLLQQQVATGTTTTTMLEKPIINTTTAANYKMAGKRKGLLHQMFY